MLAHSFSPLHFPIHSTILAYSWVCLWSHPSTLFCNTRFLPIIEISFYLLPPAGHIQIVRGLLMGSLAVGALGFVLSMMGMECTFLGGKEKPKHRKVYAGGCFHILSGKQLGTRGV